MELCSGRTAEVSDYKKAYCGDPLSKPHRSGHEFAYLDKTLAALVALSSEESRKVGCSNPSDPGPIRNFVYRLMDKPGDRMRVRCPK